MRARQFLAIGEPGLAHSARALDDPFARLLGGIADAGVFPRELVGIETSLVPVDRVCAAMVRLAERRGGTFHYFRRGATAFGRVRALLAARGRPTVWDAFVGAVVERGARSPLAGLVEWLRASREAATRLAEAPGGPGRGCRAAKAHARGSRSSNGPRPPHKKCGICATVRP